MAAVMLLLSFDRGEEYCDEYVSAHISQELHIQSLPNFLHMLPMTVPRSSSGSVAIHYEFPVLWIMSCFLMLWSQYQCVTTGASSLQQYPCPIVLVLCCPKRQWAPRLEKLRDGGVKCVMHQCRIGNYKTVLEELLLFGVISCMQ